MSETKNLEPRTEAKPMGYTLMLGFTVMCVALAATTALPLSASRPNVLGYSSCCPFAPWSTLALLALAGGSCVTRSRVFNRGARNARRGVT